MIPRRKLKPLQKVVASIPGFRLLSVERSGGDHLCCHIRDDKGNRFKVWTGSTGSSCKRRFLNLKQDIKRVSNRMKGLID